MRSWGILVLVTTTCGCFAQAPTQTATPPRVMSADDPTVSSIWSNNIGNEPVGPGDLLYITVSGSPEFSRSYRVGEDGSIVLPMGHNNVQVSGLTPEKVANAVAADLQDEKILVSPIVSTAVLDYRSRQVTVAGAVKVPAVLQAVGNLTVLDALSKCQGLAPEAGPVAIVTRSVAGSTEKQVTTIPLKELMGGVSPELNLALHGGDDVRVPEAPKVFIVGNVKMPGIYPITEAGGTTVLKALAQSQGQLTFTTKDAYIYRNIDGHRNEIEVPLRKILHRSAPDVALLANDVLYVPESSKLHLTATVLDHMTSFGSEVGSGLIIWH